MTVRFYPSNFLSNKIVIKNISTDSNVSLQKQGDNLFSVFNSPIKNNFNLLVEAELPNNWKDLFIVSERANPPAELVLNFESKDSRSKGAIRMRPLGGNNYEGAMPLSFIDWRGRIKLEVKLIRTTKAKQTKGFYTEPFTTLSDSEIIMVDVSEKIVEEKGGDLSMKWESFAGHEARKGALYYLDLESDLSKPMLKFNEDMDDELKTIILSKAKGLIGKKRDSMWSSTSADVWELLATKTFENIRDGDENNFEALGSPWTGIASSIATLIYPGMSSKDAEDILISDCRSDEEGNLTYRELLNYKLPLAVQKKVGLLKSFESLSTEE